MSLSPMPVWAAGGNGFAVRRPPFSDLRSPSRGAVVDLTERTEAQGVIARLRETVERMDGSLHQLPEALGRVRQQRPAWRLGLEPVDQYLPERGLPPFALHDVAPQQFGDMPATMGFALALARLALSAHPKQRPVLWCRIETEQREHGRLYGYGLAQMGLPRSRFLTLTLRTPKALLWVLEEALKSSCLSVVMGDVAVQHMSLTISRRLALAASEGKTTGLLVFNRNYMEATASASRWCIAALPSSPHAHDARAPGFPAWEVALTRIRSGRPGRWPLAWNPPLTPLDTHDLSSPYFSLVPGFSGGALYPGAPEAAETLPAAEPALRAG